MSAADIFRGVVFVDGPLVDSVPAFADISPLRRVSAPDFRPAYERVEREVLAEVEATSPQFLAEFASDMRSGNPLKVQRAIRRASIAATKATRNLPEVVAARRDLLEHPERLAEVSAAMQRETARASSSVGEAREQDKSQARVVPDSANMKAVPAQEALNYSLAKLFGEELSDVGDPDSLPPVGNFIISGIFGPVVVLNQVLIGFTYAVAVNAAVVANIYYHMNVYFDVNSTGALSQPSSQVSYATDPCYYPEDCLPHGPPTTSGNDFLRKPRESLQFEEIIARITQVLARPLST